MRPGWKVCLALPLLILGGCISGMIQYAKDNAPSPLLSVMLPEASCTAKATDITFGYDGIGSASAGDFAILWQDANHLAFLPIKDHFASDFGLDLSRHPEVGFVVNFQSGKAEKVTEPNRLRLLASWFRRQRRSVDGAELDEASASALRQQLQIKQVPNPLAGWIPCEIRVGGAKRYAGVAVDRPTGPGASGFQCSLSLGGRLVGPFPAGETEPSAESFLYSVFISPDQHYGIYQDKIVNILHDGGFLKPQELTLYTWQCSDLVRIVPTEDWRQAALVFRPKDRDEFRVQRTRFDSHQGWSQPGS